MTGDDTEQPRGAVVSDVCDTDEANLFLIGLIEIDEEIANVEAQSESCEPTARPIIRQKDDGRWIWYARSKRARADPRRFDEQGAVEAGRRIFLFKMGMGCRR